VSIATLKSSIATATAAAAILYLLDPVSGRRRRAILRDRVMSRFGTALRGIDAAGRDLAHRTHGLTACARRLLDSSDTSDEILVERVRTALGRAVSHPGAIDVSSTDGRVVLSGPVLNHEHARLLRTVRSVRGVHAVEDRLDLHTQAGRIPALQGGRPRSNQTHLVDENWPPALRLLTIAGGTALALWGLRQRGIPAFAITAVGGTLALRGSTNAPLRRLAGAQGRRAIDVQKTMHVNAPVERVFEVLSRYENFPAFMRNVRRVTMHPDGRYHWVVAGPAGASIEWDAETTACVPNELLAWRTARGATIEHAGNIRFEHAGDGTRLTIRMTYNPPGGAFGHVVAKLFGADPKTELDEDLMRLKSFMETGIEPHDAAAHRASAARGRSRPVHQRASSARVSLH
jgi:uncharacterized membrane protein